MLRKSLLFFILTTVSLSALPLEEGLRKVEACLIVGDSAQAVELARSLSTDYPESPEAVLALIKALCSNEDEKSALEVWIKSEEALKTKKLDHPALERLAWGVLTKAQDSPQLPILMNALYGIGLTNDYHAVPLIIKQMRHPSAIVRALAVRTAAQLGDQPLKEELKKLLQNEKVWYVRLEVIQAVGNLKMKGVVEPLKEILSSSKSLTEEKTAAILSILRIMDEVDDKELKMLLSSDRSGHRELFCALVVSLEMWDKIPQLVRLVADQSVDVKIAALHGLAMAGQVHKLDEKAKKTLFSHTEHGIAEVAITAAWASLVSGNPQGGEKLQEWIKSPKLAQARIAAAALSAAGAAAVPQILKVLDEVSDPYVKFNLAWGLIGQRSQEKKACAIFVDMLARTGDSLLMWDQSMVSSFQCLSPSKLRHIDQIPNFPKIIDQLVRLEILSVLSMRKDEGALPAIRSFLEKSDWGVVAEASSLLLQEGDASSLDEVKKLLNDPSQDVRLQAALMLALVANDSAAIPVLLEVYPKMPREQKVQILLALGYIGDRRSIPFFLERMQEPFQQLKVLSASCLIQCLYH